MSNGDEQLSGKQLTWGYWYVTHKEQLRKIGIWALIVFCVLAWGFALVRFGYFLIVEEPQTQRAVQKLPEALINVSDVHNRFRAQDFVIVETETFSAGEGRYDFFARLQNPNPRYALPSFTYSFVYDGGITAQRVGYLLPEQGIILSDLGVDLPRPPRNARLVIDAASWKHVGNWEALAAEKSGIVVTDIRTTPLTIGGRGGTLVEFTVTNTTSYSFWSIEIPIVFERGVKTLGVNRLELQQLLSGESRPIRLQWFDAPSGASTIRIEPQVNILDPSQFLKARGETPNVVE